MKKFGKSQEINLIRIFWLLVIIIYQYQSIIISGMKPDDFTFVQ